MEDRIYLKDMPCYQKATEAQKSQAPKNAYYDLGELLSPYMREVMKAFIKMEGRIMALSTVYSRIQYYRKLCRFLKKKARGVQNFNDRPAETWMRQYKSWLLEEGVRLTYEHRGLYGNLEITQSKVVTYLRRVLEFEKSISDFRPEIEKDIWELDKLNITIHANPIKNNKTLNFIKISQQEIREELKKGIYLNLQTEAIACVQKEITAMYRLSKFLAEKKKEVQSCRDIDRRVMEEYLIYLKTENTSTKHYHADLNRLRAILESINRVCDYKNLNGLFLNRDIPAERQSEFKAYSDEELRRLNADLVDMDEQYARVMIIHQMLGTRISDTLTLEMDCLDMQRSNHIIKIRQMKTKTYEKPISEELATLINKAMDYTRERYGQTKYIFVDEKNPEKPLQYNTIQCKVMLMIKERDLRDDYGRIFGFGTHLYRHTYGMKLTEMHLDDFTIAKLLGHSSVRNVKYYRKMGNQMLADETRKVRQMLSEIILQNLDGWEEEYEQIRQDAGNK